MTLLDAQELQRTISCWTSVLGTSVQTVTTGQIIQELAAGSIIWDVRSSQAHQAGHPEGARSLGGIDWLLADAFGGNLVPRLVIANRLAEIGIEPGKRVVVCSTTGGIEMPIALRALRAIGVGDLAVCDLSPSASAI